jgi:hypothetical protein
VDDGLVDFSYLYAGFDFLATLQAPQWRVRGREICELTATGGWRARVTFDEEGHLRSLRGLEVVDRGLRFGRRGELLTVALLTAQGSSEHVAYGPLELALELDARAISWTIVGTSQGASQVRPPLPRLDSLEAFELYLGPAGADLLLPTPAFRWVAPSRRSRASALAGRSRSVPHGFRS